MVPGPYGGAVAGFRPIICGQILPSASEMELMAAKINLVDKAYKEIKHRIITYQFKPGAALTFDRLSEALKMSQTPIREALSRLWIEHFVERQGAKGYVVSSLNATQIDELYELRMILEVSGIRRAAHHVDKHFLSGLKNILEAAEALMKEGRRAEIIALDRDFHVAVLKQSRNKLLSELGENILDRVYRVQNLDVLTSDRLWIAHGHHTEIFSVLQQEDAHQAAQLMQDHLISAREHVLSRLANDDDILRQLLA